MKHSNLATILQTFVIGEAPAVKESEAAFWYRHIQDVAKIDRDWHQKAVKFVECYEAQKKSGGAPVSTLSTRTSRRWSWRCSGSATPPTTRMPRRVTRANA
jgi:hypothetical protein